MEQTLRTFEEHFETSWWQTLNVFSWMLTSRSRMTCLSDTNQTMLTRLKSSSQVWTDMQSMENYFLLDHMIGLSREKRPVILMLSIRLAVSDSLSNEWSMVLTRSEESRVGKERVITCRYRLSTYNIKRIKQLCIQDISK